MFVLRTGIVPVLRRVALPVMAVLSAACLVGGCSSRPDGRTSFIWSKDAPAYHVAAAPPRPAEMEDDGREAQVPPPRSIRSEPDDPSQPYSPNYGSTPPAPQRSAGVTAQPHVAPGSDAAHGERLPDDLPPAFRRKLASALSED